MITLEVNKAEIECTGRELLTSGAQKAYTCRYHFSSDWDGLNKTAVFLAGTESRSVLLDSTGVAVIPWELLQNAGAKVFAGVYGSDGSGTVLPTVWAFIGTVRQGITEAEAGEEPTVGAYAALLAAVGSLEELGTEDKTSLVAALNEVLALVPDETEMHTVLQALVEELAESGTLDGSDGASAYEAAVANGYSGTEAEWLESLKGEPGEDGEAATIKIGSVTTGAAGTDATVNNSGTETEVILDFVIPRGADGEDGSGETEIPEHGAIFYLDSCTAKLVSDGTALDYETVMNMAYSGELLRLWVNTDSEMSEAFTLARFAGSHYTEETGVVYYYMATTGTTPLETIYYIACAESGWSYTVSTGGGGTSGLPDVSGYDDGYILITSGGEWTIAELGDIEDITEEAF